MTLEDLAYFLKPKRISSTLQNYFMILGYKLIEA